MSIATEVLSAEQIQEEAKWITEMYATVDRQDLAVFDTFFTDDATVNFANSPTLTKKEDILGQFKYLFDACEVLQHVFERVYAVNGQVMVSSLIKYRFVGGAETSVKGFTVCHKKPGEAKATRVDIIGDFGESGEPRHHDASQQLFEAPLPERELYVLHPASGFPDY
ncbi:hypothetical protein AX16_006229 [Volvariella volvacea WC 439]|nr:hypothetical protein AX16_006229 [Volvariella volvacea WC 439]